MLRVSFLFPLGSAGDRSPRAEDEGVGPEGARGPALCSGAGGGGSSGGGAGPAGGAEEEEEPGREAEPPCGRKCWWRVFLPWGETDCTSSRAIASCPLHPAFVLRGPRPSESASAWAALLVVQTRLRPE